MGKNQGFVCQNCGRNVPANTDRCTHCGRFFKGVRCPMCHYIGESADFVNGCPSCNYLATDNITTGNSIELKQSLPTWLYLVSVIVLTIIMATIIFNIYKM